MEIQSILTSGVSALHEIVDEVSLNSELVLELLKVSLA